MEKTEILALLGQLPGYEWNRESDYVEEPISDPFGSGAECLLLWMCGNGFP